VRPRTMGLLFCWPPLILALAACGMSSDEGPHETTGEQTVFHEQRENIEAAVNREISQLETAIADLRAEADATTENFTSEFVHVDQLMSGLRARLENARVESEQGLETLRSDTRAQIEEIQEAVTNLQARVDAAKESEEPASEYQSGTAQRPTGRRR